MAALVLTAAGCEAHARAKHATAPSKVTAKATAHGKATAGSSAAAPGASACTDSDETALWWSPAAPTAGAAVKLLAVGEESGAGELSVIDPAGARHALTAARHPGVARQPVGRADRAARRRLPGDLDARGPDARLPDD